MCKILHNWIWTDVAALAFLALAAAPYLVKLLAGGGHEGGVVGEDAGFEIAAAGRLHAHARAGEVGAAHVANHLVDDDDFEVYARAEGAFQQLGEARVAVEVGAEVRSGLLGMDEPHLHALAEQFGQHPEEWFLGLALRHVQVLDVGGADPQRLFDLHREVKDGGVMGGVSDEGGGHGGNGKLRIENGIVQCKKGTRFSPRGKRGFLGNKGKIILATASPNLKFQEWPPSQTLVLYLLI